LACLPFGGSGAWLQAWGVGIWLRADAWLEGWSSGPESR